MTRAKKITHNAQLFADMKTPFTREATNGDINLCDAIRKKAIATLNAERENLTLAKVDAMAWRIWHQDYAA